MDLTDFLQFTRGQFVADSFQKNLILDFDHWS